MSIDKSIRAIDGFKGVSLTQRLSQIENAIIGNDAVASQSFCSKHSIDDTFVESALVIKKVAGQIHVIIHATGILHALKDIMQQGEIVESVSLGAGNTGRKFDLETNLQIAEFKFIDWQGGAETIRQNGIFKDFYELAEYDTNKKRVLYVVDTNYPLKFFNGRRTLKSVLSKQPIIFENIKRKYGERMKVVSDYYEAHKDHVFVTDVSPFIGRK